MLDIVQQVVNKAVNFECVTGKNPVNIYLGTKEARELSDWIRENKCCGTEIKVDRSLKPTIAGMFIYKVLTESHLECS